MGGDQNILFEPSNDSWSFKIPSDKNVCNNPWFSFTWFYE